MSGSIRAALAMTLVLSLLAAMPAQAAALAPPTVVPAHPAALGDGLANYDVPGDQDVAQVAVSPDGEFVAGITTGGTVLAFTNSTSVNPSPIASLTLPDGTDASTVAISSQQSNGGPHVMVVGFGSEVVAYNLSATSGDVTLTLPGSAGGSGSEKPVWAITDWAGLINLPTLATDPFVHQVVISDNATWVGVMAAFHDVSVNDVLITYAENFGATYENLSYYYGTPVNLGIATGGGLMDAGINTVGDSMEIIVFQGTSGNVGTFNAFVNAGEMLSDGISGNGALCYAVTYGGIYIINRGTLTTNATSYGPTIPATNISITSGTDVAPSYWGTSILIGGAGSPDAYYYNYSSKVWSDEWHGTFNDNLYNVSLASRAPDYFLVSSGLNVYWFYYYAGMSQDPANSAYRNATTFGEIHETALSDYHDTAVIGSSYVNGESAPGAGELSIASDGGLPDPATPAVSVEVLSPSPGAPSAGLSVDWSETGTAPISEVVLFAKLATPNANSISPPGVSPLTGSPYDLNGLSFSTSYCVSVEVWAYGGETHANSSWVCATTAGQPQSVDPVVPFEVASASVLGIGVVGLVALVLLTGRRRRDRLQPAPMGSGGVPPGAPPAGGR